MGDLLSDGFEYGGYATVSFPGGWFQFSTGTGFITDDSYSVFSTATPPKDQNGNGGAYFARSGSARRELKRTAKEVWASWRWKSVRDDANNRSAVGFTDSSGAASLYLQKTTTTSMQLFQPALLATSVTSVHSNSEGFREWHARFIVANTTGGGGVGGEYAVFKDKDFDNALFEAVDVDTQGGSEDYVNFGLISLSDSPVDDLKIWDATVKCSTKSGTVAVGETLTGNVTGTTFVVTSLVGGSATGNVIIQAEQINIGGTGTPTRWNNPTQVPWSSDTELTNGTGWVASPLETGTTWLANVDAGGAAVGLIGSATGAEIDVQAPSGTLGDCYVAEDTIAASEGTSDTPAVGDVLEFDGASWKIIVPNIAGFPGSSIRLIVSESTFVTSGGLTDATDEGKIALFDGASLTPTSFSTPSASDAVVVDDATSVNFQSAFKFSGTVPSGSWAAFTESFQCSHSGPPHSSYFIGGRIETDVDAARDTLSQAGTRTPETNVAATETLTLVGQPNNNDQTELGAKTYTYQTVLTDVDGNVLIGATASDTIDNLIAAITLGAGSGSTYAASTTAHANSTAAAGAGDTMDASALQEGTLGNLLTCTNPTNVSGNLSWGGVVLSGGVGGSFNYSPPWPDPLSDATALASHLEADTTGEKYIGEVGGSGGIADDRGIADDDIDSIEGIQLSVFWDKAGAGLDNGTLIFESGGTEYLSAVKSVPGSPGSDVFSLTEIPDATAEASRLEGAGTEITLTLLKALRAGMAFET